MTPRRTRLAPAAIALSSILLVLLPSAAGSVTTPIEAVNEGSGIYGETHRWSPSAETVIGGSVVTFRNQTAVPHGVHWVNVPVEPKCEGVPVGTTAAASATGWTGTCTFEKEGTYTFYCTVHGPEMTGTVTVPGTPQASTEAPGEVSQRAATLTGAVDPKGQAVEYRFQYGTASVSEHTTGTLALGAADFASHSVTSAVSGLSPGTEYKVRLVASYEAGKAEALGGERTFTTPPITAPAAATDAASGVSETAATLKGTVATGGEATEYDFEYGPDESYGKVTEVKTLPAGVGSQGVSAVVAGLTPGTTYHFRLVAKNALGPGTGKDVTLTTPSPAPPSEPPASPPPLPQGTPSPPSPAPSALPAQPGEELSPILAGSFELKASAHGAFVRGSIGVLTFGAGGRLEVDLVVPATSLGRTGRPKQVVVGRLVRGSVAAGRSSFSLALDARGKRALRRRHRLAVTVRVTLTPPGGHATVITKRLVLRA